MALVPCRECGRDISTEAPTCPLCGAPNPAGTGFGYEFVSRTRLGGLPLVHVAFGRTAAGRWRVARGIVAIGQFAVGVVSICQFGFGILCFAQFGTGALVLAQFGAGAFCLAQFGVALAGWGAFVVVPRMLLHGARSPVARAAATGLVYLGVRAAGARTRRFNN